MTVDEPQVVVAVSLITARLEPKLHPMVLDGVVDDGQGPAVLVRQVDENLLVMPAVDRTVVREHDPHADEEEQREGDERYGTVFRTDRKDRPQHAQDAEKDAADDREDVGDTETDERCCEHLVPFV